MFSTKFTKMETPMVIYTSAEVDIFLMTKNKCNTSTIVRQYWQLYKITPSGTNLTEELLIDKLWRIKFTFKPGKYELGVYRLYARIGYPGRSMAHWMEESMYIKIEHPPPQAFITGGSGRTIGTGDHIFDALTGSYSLTKGPGDPSGLTFEWLCLNFVTKEIYTLLRFNFDSILLFNDTVVDAKKKWYETTFLPRIENFVAFLERSQLYSQVLSLKANNSQCQTADYFNVSYSYEKAAASSKNDMECDKPFQSCSDQTPQEPEGPFEYELVPLTAFYDIDYMSDYQRKKKPKSRDENVTTSSDYVASFPSSETVILNEFKELIEMLFSDGDFIEDVTNFYIRLAESTLTISGLYGLNGLPGLPPSANASFFDDLETWLYNANVSKTYENEFLQMFGSFSSIKGTVEKAYELQKYIGTTNYLMLAIDGTEKCLLDYLGDLFVGMVTINSFNWYTMQKQELFYIDWIKNDVASASGCDLFTPSPNGTANLTVTAKNATDGVGYLVYIRVEFEKSYTHFLQHAQSVETNPSMLNVE